MVLPVATEGALEWLLPSVYDDVVQESLSGDELLAADGADQQLLAGVEPHVLGQVTLPLEAFTALLAFVCRGVLTLFLQSRYVFFCQLRFSLFKKPGMEANFTRNKCLRADERTL